MYALENLSDIKQGEMQSDRQANNVTISCLRSIEYHDIVWANGIQ